MIEIPCSFEKREFQKECIYKYIYININNTLKLVSIFKRDKERKKNKCDSFSAFVYYGMSKTSVVSSVFVLALGV